jgi:hypothetical protein
MGKAAFHQSNQGIEHLRHQPENTILYKVIRENVATVFQNLEIEGKSLPKFVQQEFAAFLDCGILAKGFLRVRCESCAQEKLVAFSCKKRGFCPSCGGRRMSDTAAHLVDHVFPKRPVRQWVLSFPYNLRYLFAYNHQALQIALQIMIRVIRRYYLKKARSHGKSEIGAATIIQRFGGKLNLNPHFHVLFLDGVFDKDGEWVRVVAPTDEEVAEIVKKIRIRVFRSLEKKEFIKGHDINFDVVEADALTELTLGSIHGGAGAPIDGSPVDFAEAGCGGKQLTFLARNAGEKCSLTVKQVRASGLNFAEVAVLIWTVSVCTLMW